MNAPPSPAAPAPNPPAPGPTPVLEMVGLSAPSLNNPRLIILEDITWSAAAGDFWAVGGLQGSGKSDFVAVAAGILPPARGVFRMFGRELAVGFEQDRLEVQLRLGLVFDGGRLLSHLTVAENISLPMRYHQNRGLEAVGESLRALLDFAGLQRWSDLHPGSLAPTIRQRAGLARALALRPEVLLLDAPLTGLDPAESAWWLERLAGLHAGHPLLEGRPLTLVVTADDLRPWSRHARQFAVLKHHRLVELPTGPATEPEAFLAQLQAAPDPES